MTIWVVFADYEECCCEHSCAFNLAITVLELSTETGSKVCVYYFEKLAYVTMESGKSKMCRVVAVWKPREELQFESKGGRISSSSGQVSLCSPKTFN